MHAINALITDLARAQRHNDPHRHGRARQVALAAPARPFQGWLLLCLVALMGLMLTVGTAPVSAQEEDLGNDGIDQDCADFPERNAVEGYFSHDGGSADRNVDGLDPDGNGVPCDEADYDGAEDDEVTGLPVTGAGAPGSTGVGILPVLLGAVLSIVMLALSAHARRRS